VATVAQINKPTCSLVSEQGRTIVITQEVYEAIASHVIAKTTGMVKLEFKDGGIAGVESTTVKRYK
jgi:hypothetical protein